MKVPLGLLGVAMVAAGGWRAYEAHDATVLVVVGVVLVLVMIFGDRVTKFSAKYKEIELVAEMASQVEAAAAGVEVVITEAAEEPGIDEGRKDHLEATLRELAFTQGQLAGLRRAATPRDEEFEPVHAREASVVHLELVYRTLRRFERVRCECSIARVGSWHGEKAATMSQGERATARFSFPQDFVDEDGTPAPRLEEMIAVRRFNVRWLMQGADGKWELVARDSFVDRDV